MTDFPMDLSYACVDVKPIDYQFTGERWAESTEDGGGWRVCEGTILSSEQDLEIDLGEIGVNIERRLELDPDSFEIEVITTRTNDDGDEDEEVKTLAPTDKDYDAFAEHFKLDGDEVRHHINDDDDDWQPQMNYAYPLDREPLDDWKTHVVTCTCVEIDGEHYLALTGGGMDLSWEICESYMRLGYFPPAHFANLPAMAGRGMSERDKWIIEGCRKSLQGMRDRAERALTSLDHLVKWAKEDEIERATKQQAKAD